MGLRAAWRGVASGYAMRGGGMNGSTAWADAPQNAAPLFVPSRLELMRNAPNWCPWMQDVTDAVLDLADLLRDTSGARILDEDKEYLYDQFVTKLLFLGFTDSVIYRAQWQFIQDETARRNNNTKGDA